jgi:hypothetical protein
LYLCNQLKSIVPEPLWPNPDKEPLPEPVINAIVKKPPTRSERKVTEMFSIWTPDPDAEGDENEQVENNEEGGDEQ